MSEKTDEQVLLKLGELTGAVREMHVGMMARIGDIRDDIARLEAAQNRIEDGLGKRIDSLSGRVTSLEAEDKKIIERVARLSAFGGGAGGLLAAMTVELIKRF